VDDSDYDPGAAEQLGALYSQLSQGAARLMVVHEAGRILRSSQDPKELASGLLDTIAEALFAVSGCVASLTNDEFKILATRGLLDEEVDALYELESEARFWFAVADAETPLTREDLLAPEEGVEGGEAEEETGGLEEAGEGGAGAETGEDVTELTEEMVVGEVDAEPGAEPGTEAAPDGPAFLLYVPLRLEDRVLGILALGPRVDRTAYGQEDRDLAESLASHLALALNSAALSAEQSRRIEELSVLLRISKEITSTLDLDQVLHTITHMLSLVLPNRRTTVALVLGDTISIRASSAPDFDVKTADQDYLLPALRWAHGARKEVNTSHSLLHGNPAADGRDVLLSVLAVEGGPSGLAILPLKDDQGVVGFLSIESEEDAPPLDDQRRELVSILANQTTVAMRNAELYHQVPSMGVLSPLLGRGRKAAGRKRSRLGRRGMIVAAVLALGLLIPVPSWVSGDATVRPASFVSVRAGTEGIVSAVRVREGERVTSGTVLAEMRRDELEVRLEQAQADAERARVEALRARSAGDLAAYRSRQAELAHLGEAEAFLEGELRRASLVAPISGVVLTPRVDLRVGQHLGRGESLLDLGDVSSMEADVLVPEEEISAVATGVPARLKVYAYPSRTFQGKVGRISPRADASGRFRVTVLVENGDGALRPGMTGRAHVHIPARPFLLSFFRPLLRGLRFRLWM
jgi:RND family efflux transporter MFP subunit